MEISSVRELQATCEKLRLLDEHYRMRLGEPVENSRTRKLSLRSLKKMMNQLTEGIARFETRRRTAQ